MDATETGTTPNITRVAVAAANGHKGGGGLNGVMMAAAEGDHGFESPLKAMKVNFRMNQLFGIFPYSISQDFLVFR